jgi:hypothetical protein
MAIHDLWSFDNAPVGTSLLTGTTDLTSTTGPSNVYNYYTGNPGCTYTYTSSPFAVDANGFANSTNNSSGNGSMIWFKLAQVLNFTTSTKWAIGFRTKSSQAVTGSTAGRVFCTTAGWATAILRTWIAEADLVAPANTELYVELVVDSSLLTYWLYINGSLVRQTAYTSGNFPSTGYAAFGTGSTVGTANATRGYRDFYFLDFDSTDTTRLGPIRSSIASLSNISGSEWTLNSAADLPTALNTVLQNPPITTPSASAPADNQPITATLGTSLAANVSIIAVQPMISFIGDSALNTLDLTLTQNAQALDLGKLAPPVSANQFNQKWAISRKAPDGGIWTPTKLGQTSASLTPAAQRTVVLLHMENTTDAAVSRTWTLNGTAAISTAQTKFGSSSLTSGSSGYLSAPVDATEVFGSTFTFECWAYRNSGFGDTNILSMSTQNDSTHQTGIGQQSNMGLAIYLTDGKAWQSLAPTSAFPLNQWNHVAVVYNNGVYTGYINGVAQGSITSASTFGLAGATCTIGGIRYNSVSQFPGYLDEVRLSNVARYTANFTPPTAAFVLD